MGIFTANDETHGFTLSTTKAEPIEFAGIILHGGIDRVNEGPSFSVKSQRSSGVLWEITGGVSFFESSDVDSTAVQENSAVVGVTLGYIFAEKKFQGKLSLKAPKFIKDKATIDFEIYKGKSDQKMHFRFTNLPTFFDNIIDVVSTLEKMSSAKPGKCGPLKLFFK